MSHKNLFPFYLIAIAIIVGVLITRGNMYKFEDKEKSQKIDSLETVIEKSESAYENYRIQSIEAECELYDSIFTLGHIIYEKEEKINSLKEKYAVLKSNLKNTSAEQDYNFLQALYGSTGSEKWSFDSSQVKQLRYAEIERKECLESLGLTQDKLMMIEYDSKVYKSKLENTQLILKGCNYKNQELEDENLSLESEKNKYKKKSKRRGIAAGALSIISIILIL